jgi:hypothetical protein
MGVFDLEALTFKERLDEEMLLFRISVLEQKCRELGVFPRQDDCKLALEKTNNSLGEAVQLVYDEYHSFTSIKGLISLFRRAFSFRRKKPRLHED